VGRNRVCASVLINHRTWSSSAAVGVHRLLMAMPVPPSVEPGLPPGAAAGASPNLRRPA
jgi:hypothetical protein